jgi:hypothetical protein
MEDNRNEHSHGDSDNTTIQWDILTPPSDPQAGVKERKAIDICSGDV